MTERIGTQGSWIPAGSPFPSSTEEFSSPNLLFSFFIFFKISFLSSLHTQLGARTDNSEIKSHTLY